MVRNLDLGAVLKRWAEKEWSQEDRKVLVKRIEGEK